MYDTLARFRRPADLMRAGTTVTSHRPTFSFNESSPEVEERLYVFLLVLRRF